MVFSPRDHPTGLVFLLSDATGWSGQMTTVAEHLRQRGLIVVGIDTAGEPRAREGGLPRPHRRL
jgi:alpha-beta hydrolase superfamily lysophospholipase